MKNYLLTLSYNGAGYSGWQRQKNARTVQQTLEETLLKLTGETVVATASGRTDEGVHALGQTVSFACNTSIPAHKFADALNSVLPGDIRAADCKEVDCGFCARKSAKRKTYVYRMYLSDSVVPHADGYALRVDKPINAELMDSACKIITGTHDFKQFYCLGSSAKTTVRTVYECSFNEYPPTAVMPVTYEFIISGNGFLYKMVRLLAGALLSLDYGKITLSDFTAAINGEEGRVKKVPAPGKGLALLKVEYI